jgi:hypothetical protein
MQRLGQTEGNLPKSLILGLDVFFFFRSQAIVQHPKAFRVPKIPLINFFCLQVFLVRISELFLILIRRITFLEHFLGIQLTRRMTIDPTFRIMHLAHISSPPKVIKIIHSSIPTLAPQPPIPLSLRPRFTFRDFFDQIIVSNICCLISVTSCPTVVRISRRLIIFLVQQKTPFTVTQVKF